MSPFLLLERRLMQIMYDFNYQAIHLSFGLKSILLNVVGIVYDILFKRSC
jgi:hypothetical protein